VIHGRDDRPLIDETIIKEGRGVAMVMMA